MKNYKCKIQKLIKIQLKIQKIIKFMMSAIQSKQIMINFNNIKLINKFKKKIIVMQTIKQS